MSHHDAPPETDVQRQAREWWTDRLGACAVGWGRDRNGKFLSEFARNAEAAWTAARNTRAASGGDSATLEQRARYAFEEWFAAVEAGDGTIPVPQSIADGPAWHEHIGRRQMAQGAWFEAIKFAALANQQGVGRAQPATASQIEVDNG